MMLMESDTIVGVSRRNIPRVWIFPQVERVVASRKDRIPDSKMLTARHPF